MNPASLPDWKDREMKVAGGYLVFRHYGEGAPALPGWLVRFTPFNGGRTEKVEGVSAEDACFFANERGA